MAVGVPPDLMIRDLSFILQLSTIDCGILLQILFNLKSF